MAEQLNCKATLLTLLASTKSVKHAIAELLSDSTCPDSSSLRHL